ncbi:UDP-glucose 4-epimerase GalE [Loktanella sp. D2R18]|uniref:UDP-glucose 4-epimerase GalE n=1 Tax=Rhodobacterales TaxID=204455 RepID=UPI000DE96C59|nr:MULTISPECIES: UDP-glucose 4-epimerase GalE [Rhodobacterales]MDO6591258.1 UDP-glucose 4-epimerase GalE [Yoonia sp. 1_MG-2023]RBW46213.1 UDP-glucose 4-epimerase GalE [Loktanella sp. D2R18]
MRVLVTGGAGYIGSHTLLELMAQGHEVCVLDDYSNATPEVLNRVRVLSNGTVTDYTGDVRDPAMLDQVMQDFRPDAVIHFAGLKAVGESEAKPLLYYDVNVGGTLALLRAMDRVGCRTIIFSSSATVYGEPVYLPYDEAHPTAPMSVYGQSKLMAENILTGWAHATQGAAAVLLRYFNPVGAHHSSKIGEDPKDIPNNLMPYIAQVAVGKRPALTVFGDDYDTPDGTGLRDYIHVVDLARAHVAALGYAIKTPGARPFNIGTGQSYSVRDMVAAFESACGQKIATVQAPRRAGDIAAMQADASRAAAELGWRAEHDLNDMAASTWAWQSANPNGYDPQK